MKPLTGWPRKGSVLPVQRGTVFEYVIFHVRDPYSHESVTSAAMAYFDAHMDADYHDAQAKMEAEYRAGADNAGLSPDVVQTIQWMAGTTQFLSYSGLQIVPLTEEQFFELETWLENERKLRAEQAEALKSYMMPYIPTHGHAL